MLNQYVTHLKLIILDSIKKRWKKIHNKIFDVTWFRGLFRNHKTNLDFFFWGLGDHITYLPYWKTLKSTSTTTRATWINLDIWSLWRGEKLGQELFTHWDFSYSGERKYSSHINENQVLETISYDTSSDEQRFTNKQKLTSGLGTKAWPGIVKMCCTSQRYWAITERRLRCLLPVLAVSLYGRTKRNFSK